MRTGKRSSCRIVTIVLILSLGASCDTDDHPINYDTIEGIYTCQESSSHAGTRQYPVEIDAVNNTEGLYIILNFHSKGENEFIFTEVAGDSITISNQAITDISVNGTGTVGSDFRTIRLRYITDDGVTILDYLATYNR
jgi:hypothetical protein